MQPHVLFNDFQELPDTDMSTEQIADKAEVPVPCVSCESIGNSRACLEPVVCIAEAAANKNPMAYKI